MQRSSVGRLPFGGRVFRAAISILVLVAAAACGGGGSSTSPAVPVNPETPVPPVKPVAPSIGTQPVSQSVQAGQTVTFSVTATGDAPLAYQWRRNGADVPGANAASYSLVAAAADNSTSWTVKVSNGGGTVETAPVTLSVTLPPPAPVAQLSFVAGNLGGAGNLDGLRTNARFSGPLALTSDSAGNLYVLDGGYSSPNRLRRISPDGLVTSLAGSENTSARSGIAADSKGNVYWVDRGLKVIRRWTTAGVSTTVAGVVFSDGFIGTTNPALAPVTLQVSVAVDSRDSLFAADSGNGLIQKITSQGMVSTVATVTGLLPGPYALALDAIGNAYAIRADGQSTSLVKITPDGVVYETGVRDVNRIWSDRSGNIYFNPPGESVMLKMSPTGAVTREVDLPLLQGPAAFDAQGNVFFTPMAKDFNGVTTGMNVVRKFIPGAGTADWAGLEAPVYGPAGLSGNRDLTLDSSGNLYVLTEDASASQKITKIHANGDIGVSFPAPYTDAFLFSTHISADAKGNVYFDANYFLGSCQPFFISIPPTRERYTQIQKLSSSPPTVCDQYAQVRKHTPNGSESILAGAVGSINNPPTDADGPGNQIILRRSNAIKADGDGNVFMLASNGVIRKISNQGFVTTVGQSGGTGSLTMDGKGNFYVMRGNSAWKLPANGLATWLAGSETEHGDADGAAASARFGYTVGGLAVDSLGEVYVADKANNLIRKIALDGSVTTVAGQRGKFGNALGALPGSLDGPGGLVIDASDTLYFYSGSAILKLKLRP